MYIYLLEKLSELSKIVIESSDELVFCSLFAVFLEHLRTVTGSNPCALIFKKPLPEHIVDALRLCYPELELIPYENAKEKLTELRHNILSLKPGFSVNLKHVRFIESDRRRLHFHHDGYERVTNHTIGQLPFKRLSELGLVRCHESYVVNLDFVERLQPGGFVLAGDIAVPISRTFSSDMTKYRKAFRGNPFTP